MTLKWIARDLIEKRSYRGLAELACPVLIRNCRKHRRWEYYDPVTRVGGIARDFRSLQEKLKKRYFCRQCGLYHVDRVAFVVAEDYLTHKYELNEVWFEDFLRIPPEGVET